MSKLDINKPVIFMRIAWMNSYRGVTKTDIPRGAGSFVDENKLGGEVFNFLPKGKLIYGYVRVSKRGSINIRKIGANIHEKFIEGVNVIFFSKNPELGSQYIVGCYKNATVLKRLTEIKIADGTRRHYTMYCKKEDAILIPTELRNKSIEGPGQSNLFYAGNYFSKNEIQEIFDFIENPKAIITNNPKKGRTGHSSGRGWQIDAETRKKVEVAAMDFTATYFENKGFKIIDVHKENKGWDLEAVKDKNTLLLEVKGTQNAFNSVELTPNEYKNFKSKKTSHRLCVVSHALDKDKIDIDIIYHNKKEWVNSKGRGINFKEAVSASVSIENQ